MVKAGVTTSINTKHQCITAMKEYENKSLEVRLKSEGLSNLIVGLFFVDDKILTCCFSPLISNTHAIQVLTVELNQMKLPQSDILNLFCILGVEIGRLPGR